MNEDGHTSNIRDKILTINVKPGWRAGTKITFPKEGDQGPNNIPGNNHLQICGARKYSYLHVPTLPSPKGGGTNINGTKITSIISLFFTLETTSFQFFLVDIVMDPLSSYDELLKKAKIASLYTQEDFTKFLW